MIEVERRAGRYWLRVGNWIFGRYPRFVVTPQFTDYDECGWSLRWLWFGVENGGAAKFR